MSSYEVLHAGNRISLRQGETLIGRSAYCSIVLLTPRASRRHCILSLYSDDLRIVDLGSANGTSVNDVRITEPTRLAPGDRIGIGDQVLEILLTESAPVRHAVTERGAAPDLSESTSNDAVSFGVDFFEALAQKPLDAKVTLVSLRHAADTILRRAALAPLSPGELARFRAAIEHVAGRARDPQVRLWLQQLERTAAQLPEP